MKKHKKPLRAPLALMVGAGFSICASPTAVAAIATANKLTLETVRAVVQSEEVTIRINGGLDMAPIVNLVQFERGFEKKWDKSSPA